MEYEEVKKYLKEAYEKWTEIYKEGSSDPYYTDGYLLNSCRNKILGYKKYLTTEHTMEEELLPEEFFMDTPPEVPEEYMARKKEIWVHALAAYDSYLQNKDYQYLISILDTLDENIRQKSSIDSVIEYVTNLHDSFINRDFMYLRIHEKGDFVECFSLCRQTIEEMKQQKEKYLQKHVEADGQMSLFGSGFIQERNR